MSKVYLPTSEQMDETIDNLAKIAGVLGSKVEISSWADIQKAVRLGLAPEVFPIGAQVVVPHNTYGNMVFDVVAHDYLKSKSNDNGHTMSLQCHGVLPKLQFDNQEAFYFADAVLSAGTYNFTIDVTYGNWTAGTYQFTLTKTLPKGGQLFLAGLPNQNLLGISVNAYENSVSTVVTESVPITSGNGGTRLGTFGVELNHISRCAYGSNNYKESAIRQFLNSSAEAGSVWTPQTKFDRPPTWMSTLDGFARGLDDDFLSVVGEVVVPCGTNRVYEAPDSTTLKGVEYTLNDKFYLPSFGEIAGNIPDTVFDGTTLFPYYRGANFVDRIKYNGSSAASWRTRTPSASGTSGQYTVRNTGEMFSLGAWEEHHVAPVCTIV